MHNILPSLVALLGGACLGSFATLLVWRLHHDQKGILSGRSRCTKCGKTLGVRHLIPLVSWVFQRGKCSFCHTSISIFYPLTELLFAVTAFLFVQKFYSTSGSIFLFLSVFCALLLFVYDIRFQEVDRRISLPAVGIALAWSFTRESVFLDFLLGGGIGFAFYALQYFFSRGTWVGAGDMELGAFMGLLLGIDLLFPALFLSYVLGLFVCLPFLFWGKLGRKSKVPLGAFLLPITLLFLYDRGSTWEAISSFLGLF
ncbi:prepilin peptidase [Candidatus Gracilibacteria bacterium]|nr:prepilin peptidase [Candidatus Gracilibacteria bacterium]